jgi:hypothetical protein
MARSLGMRMTKNRLGRVKFRDGAAQQAPAASCLLMTRAGATIVLEADLAEEN